MAELSAKEPPVLRMSRTVRDPALARAFVREHLADLDPGVLYDATLLASELVTNVVIHGQLPAYLEIVRDPTPRLIMRDGAAPFAYVRIAPSPKARSGRGMGIIAALAKSWGMQVEPGVAGKAIWVEIDVSPDDASGPAVEG